MSITSIEWTEATWNPVTGCTIVSEGCRNCYAMRMAARLEAMGQKKYEGTTKKVGTRAVWTGKVNLIADDLDIPLKRQKPTMWFVNSMSDLFHKDIPFDFVDKVFAVMALTPQHTYQILTKRPERMAEYMRDAKGRVQNAVDDAETWDNSPIPDDQMAPLIQWPLPNAWLLASAENQETYDERIHHLTKFRAAVRGLSLEPLLGPINLKLRRAPTDDDYDGYSGDGPIDVVTRDIHWVIVGGESGPGARPMHPDWVRSLRDQCDAGGIAFFFKQWGAWEVAMEHKGPNGCLVVSGNGDKVRVIGIDGSSGRKGNNPWAMVQCVGKKSAGRMLDGREWNEFPNREAVTA